MSEAGINVLIGALFCILGAILSRIEDIIKFIRFFKKPPSYLCTDWHTYHYTRGSEGPFVRYELWKVERSRTGVYHVITQDPERPRLVYDGTVRVEGHNLLLVLHRDQEETIFIRLKKPFTDREERIYGLWLGVDFLGREYCSVTLMSRDKIEDQSLVLDRLGRHAELKTIPTALMLSEP